MARAIARWGEGKRKGSLAASWDRDWYHYWGPLTVFAINVGEVGGIGPVTALSRWSDQLTSRLVLVTTVGTRKPRTSLAVSSGRSTDARGRDRIFEVICSCCCFLYAPTDGTIAIVPKPVLPKVVSLPASSLVGDEDRI